MGIDAPLRVRDTAALRDVTSPLRALCAAYGQAAVANLLGVHKAMITRWLHGSPVSQEMRGRIVDVYAVFARALQVMMPKTALAFMVGHNPYLGAKPIDVLLIRGAGPVLDAIGAFEQGAYE